MKQSWSAGEKLLAAELTPAITVAFDAAARNSLLLAGESIDGSVTPVPICIARDKRDELFDAAFHRNYYTNVGISGANWVYETFLLPADCNYIKTITLNLSKNGTGPNGTFYVDIYATSGGVITGGVLATGSIAASTITDNVENTIALSSPLNVTAGNTYAFVLRYPTGTGSVSYGYNNSNTYASGAYYTSSNSGGSWSVDANKDVYFVINGYQQLLTPGRAYKCDADVVDRAYCDGFAISNTTTGNAIEVIKNGLLGGFSSLVIGSNYYLQDAIGTIGLSMGTYPVKVGKAVSATQIVIDIKSLPFKIAANLTLLSSILTNTTRNLVDRVRLPFVPSKITGLLTATYTGASQTGKALIIHTPKGDITFSSYAVGTSPGASQRALGDFYQEDLYFAMGGYGGAYIQVRIIGTMLIFKCYNPSSQTTEVSSGSYSLLIE